MVVSEEEHLSGGNQQDDQEEYEAEEGRDERHDGSDHHVAVALIANEGLLSLLLLLETQIATLRCFMLYAEKLLAPEVTSVAANR